MNRPLLIVIGLLAVLLTACLCQSYGRQAAGIMFNPVSVTR